MTLFAAGRDLGNSALVNLSYPSNGSLLFLLCCTLVFQVTIRTFFSPSVVKPDIVIAAIMGDFFLVLYTSLPQNRVFESSSCTVLLLKLGVRGI